MRNAIFVSLLVLCSCANLVTNFDQNTVNTAQELKPIASSLVDKAINPPDQYLTDIEWLQNRLDAQVSYETGKNANSITTRQWDILASPDGNLLGSFLRDWKDGKKMSPSYVSEKKIQVEEAFDVILQFEAGKPR